jgi:hypothetical protein
MNLVDSNFERIIFIITIRGTDKSIQIIHHNDHQNHKDIIITKGLRFNLFHIIFGSIIVPRKICIAISPIEIKTNG